MAKKEFIAIGVMSGTSLDGLDIALCSFFHSNKGWNFKLIDCQYIPYDNNLVQLLKSAYNCSAREFVETDIRFGNFIGERVLAFIKGKDYKIDLVASHGHTVFHSPELGYTSQIGSGAAISSTCGYPTISDFRQQDIAYGGQGAPLVPIGDEYLFSNYAACLNLGGFANISYRKQGNRIAFDICAVNMVLNCLAERCGNNFDKDGLLAASGDVDSKLLDKLDQLPFYAAPGPKSLGKEWVEKNIFPLLNNYPIEKSKDCLRTYCEHIAFQIAKIAGNIHGEEILVTGGGAKNSFLIKCLEEKTGKAIKLPSPEIIDFKEAIIFAFLGVLRWCNLSNSLASVTGASKNTSCGALYMP
jgi:anhydro-N-acetylmuramic acid kinase